MGLGKSVGTGLYRMLYGKKVKFYFSVMGNHWRILRRKKGNLIYVYPEGDI